MSHGIPFFSHETRLCQLINTEVVQYLKIHSLYLINNFVTIINSKSLKQQRDQRSHVKIRAAESADSALFMPYDPPYDTRVKDEYEGQLTNYHL